jgi:HSP20 family protein
MGRLFDDFFERRLAPFRGGRWLSAAGGGLPSLPPVDVYEDKNEIVAKVELPGMEKDDIEINVADQLLTIKGSKKKEEEIKEDNYYRAERSYGAFVRTVELPKEVEADKAKAVFKNGVLEVRLPKSEHAREKEIKVNVQ